MHNFFLQHNLNAITSLSASIPIHSLFYQTNIAWYTAASTSLISPLHGEFVSIGAKIPPRDTQEAQKSYCTTRSSSASPPTSLSAPPTDRFRTTTDSRPPTQCTIVPTETAPNTKSTRSADCEMSRGIRKRGRSHKTRRLRCDRGSESKGLSELRPCLAFTINHLITQNITKQGPRSDRNCGVAQIERSYEIHNAGRTENVACIHYMESRLYNAPIGLS